MKKNIIITGGASGIGKSCAEEFANNEYNVIIIDKIKVNNTKSNDIDYYFCDISDELAVKKCIKQISEKYKKIDVLVNNAGVQIIDTFYNYNPDSWKSIMDTNLFGTCNIIHNVFDLMIQGSTILNILSIHSSKPRVDKYAYDCSKSALEILTKELAIDFSRKGITINGLSFGAVNTDMNKEWRKSPHKKSLAQSKVPLNIIFEPNQIARFCYIIVKEFSMYTTGSIFVIDGGRNLT